MVCTAVLPAAGGDYFQRFFGTLNPVLVLIAASVAGALALRVLQVGHGFVILRGGATLRGVVLAAALAAVVAIAAIIADFTLRYPQDINVPLPAALLFYPAIGLLAEIVFHLVPLALVLTLLRPFTAKFGRQRGTWLGFLLVAGLEASYQALLGARPFSGLVVYTGIHVYVIALLQLYLFRRFDFVSMLAFRLFYYLYWHIVWGTARLDVLF